MKRCLAFLVACLLMCSAPATIHGAKGQSDVNQQLAAARAATARYHDPSAALADGFVDMGANPAEGGTIEFVNFGLVDCTLDAAQPEGLKYVESGGQLRLVGVEYAIPMACPGAPPEDFLPGVGDWDGEPGVPVWTMSAWIWSGESIGG